MNYKTIEKKIAKHQANIAKERDKLDDFISSISALREDCDEAFESLQDARDTLSRMQ